MPFNINNFTSLGLTKGGARPSLFDVTIQFPPGFIPDSIAVEKFTFTCRATSIPASTIGQVEVPYFGRTIKLAGDRTFADWNVTIMNDEDYVVRNTFESWHSSINTIVGNRKIEENNIYKSLDAQVTHFGKTGDAIKQYKFVRIFPVNVAEMALDWESTNQIQTFDVTFAYDYWEPLNISGPAPVLI